jgi:hypothetical protein
VAGREVGQQSIDDGAGVGGGGCGEDVDIETIADLGEDFVDARPLAHEEVAM